jgi:hypothetical protein
VNDQHCMAGTVADFGGRWTLPCLNAGIHALAFSEGVGNARAPGTPVLRFCDLHLTELIAAGLIEESMSVDEWAQRTGFRP